MVEVEVDPESGELATPNCGSRRKELFVDGTQPNQPCSLHGGSTTDIIPDEDGDDDDDDEPSYTPPPVPSLESSPPGASKQSSGSQSDRPRRVAPPNDRSP